jgi:hypothetical protein
MTETEKVDAVDVIVTVDGVESEVDKVIDATLREIQQRIGGTKLLKEYAKRLGAEVAGVAEIAKGIKDPDDPEVKFLKGKVKGLEHALNVVREVVTANDNEKLRADGRVTAFRQVKKNIEAQRQTARENAERIAARTEDDPDGFEDDGAPRSVADIEGGKGRKKVGKKKKAAGKKSSRRKAPKKKTTGRKK